MKLLFDARYIKKNTDGISRHSVSLLTELNKLSNADIYLLTNNHDQTELFPKNKYIFTSHSPSSFLEIFRALQLNRYHFDAYYSPNYFYYGLFRNFKAFVTIHDLIAFRNFFPQSTLKWKLFHLTTWFLKQILKHCDAVVTVSEAVKQELLQEALTDRPIHVIGCAAFDVNIKNNSSTKTLLYIGRYERYKNITTLIGAMDFLENYTLVLAGSCNEQTKTKLLAKSNAKNRIQFLGQIDDSEYFRLLENCFALIMPSKDEGFGLPIIEAMKAGCPVICSDIAVFHEVADRAALFFDPDDAADLVHQVKHLESSEIRNHLIEQSLINVQRFSWEKNAQKLLNLLA